MTEREMEDLLWDHAERFLGEPLRQFDRQLRTDVGRTDLVFEDRLKRLLVVEIKKGTVPREVVGQVYDYLGALKRRFPLRSVEMIVVANCVPPERRLALERLHIECREISTSRFRSVAREVGYVVESEKDLIGSGDVGEFGAIEVIYPRDAKDVTPGTFPALVTDIDNNVIEVAFYYDDEPESVTLIRDSTGQWQDSKYKVPVKVNLRPAARVIEYLKRKVEG